MAHLLIPPEREIALLKKLIFVQKNFSEVLQENEKSNKKRAKTGKFLIFKNFQS